ncbi:MULTISPECIES: peptidoglycan DD-metalloendopeptidase family protein [unclassified Paraburkholderia]|uniref:peptidoglycan DD-metalloendopeptidase family protein n=1 Tax=unclassified Paraburkholderia TaxID=2615204 RepID=UPI000E23E98C|nr:MULTISPECIES: peptidoglycan DD-metalloendopeptidase family protein [unclassified Paraburkholderia]REE18773.1 murein DD-endopeptidase MepM/ murein hydrolase activator NlpD [Paraburkholderia sp. BL27I4N3]RKR45457.1 murein DD-endopeptidase MepM/ murein hydrolase activator NlpD [Paraburkholderia sp. BL17N1]
MSMLRAMQRTTLNVPMTVTQRSVCVLALSLLMTACASRLDQAPVVDRSGGGVLGTQAAQPAVPLGPPPPGYYRVKPGDTLYRIALENGQNYRDISAWNNLTNPNQIEVDQLLRVVPPGANTAALTPGVSTAPIGSGGAVQSAPLGSTPPAAGGTAGAAGVAAPPIYGSTTNNASLTPPTTPGAASDSNAGASGNVTFAWPVRGPLLGTFNDSTNKGVNIGGAAGDPVKASADGRVVYAGNGLRGYGNLIIIKHDATYLTAYAHNRSLMVKEGDAVTKGQKIAEMGNSDSDRVMLHFEVRRQGKPVDPLKYLPPQ